MVIDKPRLPRVVALKGLRAEQISLPKGGETMRVNWS
jgi:hypothetical protein